jgi:hypothetical protein
MRVVPADNAAKTPVGEIVPTAILLLTQTPPGVAFAKDVVFPVHTENVPVTGVVNAGSIVTLTVVEAEPQILVAVYVMMDVPGVTPNSKPVALPMVATPVLEDAQTPPADALVNNAEEPLVTLVGPKIVPGSGSGLIVTVTSAVAAHTPLLPLTVYVVVTVGVAVTDAPVVADNVAGGAQV